MGMAPVAHVLFCKFLLISLFQPFNELADSL